MVIVLVLNDRRPMTVLLVFIGVPDLSTRRRNFFSSRAMLLLKVCASISRCHKMQKAIAALSPAAPFYLWCIQIQAHCDCPVFLS